MKPNGYLKPSKSTDPAALEAEGLMGKRKWSPYSLLGAGLKPPETIPYSRPAAAMI